MQTMPEDHNHRRKPKAPTVPSKADFLAVLDQENGRAGLQLEWLLDRCDIREGNA